MQFFQYSVSMGWYKPLRENRPLGVDKAPNCSIIILHPNKDVVGVKCFEPPARGLPF